MSLPVEVWVHICTFLERLKPLRGVSCFFESLVWRILRSRKIRVSTLAEAQFFVKHGCEHVHLQSALGEYQGNPPLQKLTLLGSSEEIISIPTWPVSHLILLEVVVEEIPSYPRLTLKKCQMDLKMEGQNKEARVDIIVKSDYSRVSLQNFSHLKLFMHEKQAGKKNYFYPSIYSHLSEWTSEEYNFSRHTRISVSCEELYCNYIPLRSCPAKKRTIKVKYLDCLLLKGWDRLNPESLIRIKTGTGSLNFLRTCFPRLKRLEIVGPANFPLHKYVGHFPRATLLMLPN